MKKIILYTLSFFIFSSCSSEKTLSIKKPKYDWYINDMASQDNGKLRPYNFNENLKNSPVQNQTEVQAILPTVKNKQDFLASKDKAEPSVLTNNYSFKELTKVIQNEKINNSFLEKVPIFEKKKSSSKKTNLKSNINKILWIIGTALMVSLTFITTFIAGVVIAFDGLFNEVALPLSLLSALLLYLTYKSVMKTIEAFSSDNDKNDVKDSTD